MDILRPAFNTLIICGCWKPYSWMSTWKGYAYTLYTILLYSMAHTFLLAQFTETVLHVTDPDALVDSIYILLSAISSCWKMNTVLFSRKSIETLTIAIEKPYRALNADESRIRSRFEKRIDLRIIQYTAMVAMALSYIILTSLYADFRSRRLTYRVWLPFDHSVLTVYVFTYAHQMLGLLLYSFPNVACDCIVCGLLVHTCCQIEILQHRLGMINSDSVNDISDCVRYHNHIYKCGILINERFRLTVGIQFLLSTLVVCVNLYKLTNTPLGAKYVEFVVYMTCMMTQIFIYCWYGNQLKLKSMELSNTVFEMKWIELGRDVRKDLLMIMRRVTIPIEFTSAYVLTMDLKTFVGILKLSYSSYNLLQNAKETP